MNRYLPPTTRPWSRKINRQHTPKPGRYSLYKECLRWEFGFSCAFCLIHETDLLKAGTKGWSLMHVEHRIAQSDDPSQINIYNNCFYICERCNKSRSALGNEDDEGNILLDPCTVVWADHFDCTGDTVSPRPGDTSAHYTWESYNLDDPIKVQLRERRRYWMEKCAEALLDCANMEMMLVNRAVDDADHMGATETEQRLIFAKSLHRMRAPLLEKLAEFTPLPESRATSCRCGRADHLALLDVLAEQTVDLPTLLAKAEARRNHQNY